jgi:CubicO group peptidase (beta-lactamase class C family)
MMMRAVLPLCLCLAACAPLERPMSAAPPEGVSYAWASFDRTAVRDSGAGGLSDRAAKRATTIDDPVRIASVSKIVTALTVLRLAEQGKLSLDEDVSTRLGWQLRNPAFPDRPITLRQLLSHTSSIRDEGENYVIRFGQQLRPMAEQPASFDQAHAPGTYFRYSNLNFPIIGSVLERTTGERFDRLASRLVLQPLGLDACFNWTTCSDEAIGRAVLLYEEDGSPLLDYLQGRRPDCPVFLAEGATCTLESYELGSNGALFSPQGGLRISARDLATLGRLLLNRGQHGGAAFLSAASIDTMTRSQWTFNGRNGVTDDGFYCAYGLGIQLISGTAAGCRDDLFGGGRQMIGHAGAAYRVRSGLWIDPAKGVGIAYFSANNGKEPPFGRTAYRQVEEWLAGKLRD